MLKVLDFVLGREPLLALLFKIELELLVLGPLLPENVEQLNSVVEDSHELLLLCLHLNVKIFSLMTHHKLLDFHIQTVIIIPLALLGGARERIIEIVMAEAIRNVQPIPPHGLV